MDKEEEIIKMIKALFDDKGIDIVELRAMLIGIIAEAQELLTIVENYEED